MKKWFEKIAKCEYKKNIILKIKQLSLIIDSKSIRVKYNR